VKKYLQINTDGQFNVPSGLTGFIGGASSFAIWTAFQASSAGMLIDALDSSVPSGWAIELTESGKIKLTVLFYNDGSPQEFESQADGLMDGNWHFVGVNFKSEMDYSLDNTAQFYIDGVLYDLITISGAPIPEWQPSADSMYIGINNYELGESLIQNVACKIDDLRIFVGVNKTKASFDAMYANGLGSAVSEVDWTNAGLYFDFNTLTGRKRTAGGTWSNITNASIVHESDGVGGELIPGGVPFANCIDFADLIVQNINAAFSEFTAERVLVPLYETSKTKDLKVQVVPPTELTYEIFNRASTSVDLVFQIGFMKKITSETEVPGLVALVDEVVAHLRTASISGLQWVKTEVPVVYDMNFLTEQRVFASLLLVTYKRVF
jgi:hypothetical protein